jgi:hypothetical protein
MEIRRDHLEPEFFYHIYNRGINSEDVYKNKDNYLYFLKRQKNFYCQLLICMLIAL